MVERDKQDPIINAGVTDVPMEVGTYYFPELTSEGYSGQPGGLTAIRQLQSGKSGLTP